MEHEGRDADRRQQVADVDLDVHEPERLGRAGAGAASHVRRVPAQRRRVAQGVRGDAAEPVSRRRRCPVVLLEEGEAPAEILFAHAPGVVRRLHLTREGAHQDEGGGSRGVGRGEERRHRSSFGETQQDRPLRADRVQHRTNVVHTRFQVGQTLRGNSIGEAGAALVEEDESTHRREPPVKGRKLRVFPTGLERADPAMDENEVDRPVADDLVGDPDVAAARVGDLAHGSRADDSGCWRGRGNARLRARR
jgi:hypothetical protein